MAGVERMIYVSGLGEVRVGQRAAKEEGGGAAGS